MSDVEWDEEWYLREDLDDPGHDAPTTAQVLHSYAKDYYACEVGGHDGERRLAMVNRWLAEERRQAKAEALREAADMLCSKPGYGGSKFQWDHGILSLDTTFKALYDRADRLAEEVS